jgi:hypothetical protein
LLFLFGGQQGLLIAVLAFIGYRWHLQRTGRLASSSSSRTSAASTVPNTLRFARQQSSSSSSNSGNVLGSRDPSSSPTSDNNKPKTGIHSLRS